jgi:hypothetical protein
LSAGSAKTSTTTPPQAAKQRKINRQRRGTETNSTII